MAACVSGLCACASATRRQPAPTIRATASPAKRPPLTVTTVRSALRWAGGSAWLTLRHRDHSRQRIFARRVRYYLDGRLLWEHHRTRPPRLRGYMLATHRHPDYHRAVKVQGPARGAHTLVVELDYAMQRCCYAGCRWGYKARVRHTHKILRMQNARALCIQSGYLSLLSPKLQVQVVSCPEKATRSRDRLPRDRVPAVTRVAVKGWKLGVSLIPEKRTFMLGEPIYMTFKVHNLSAEDLLLPEGGDYRNRLGRPNRYKVVIKPRGGKPLPLIDSGPSRGGLTSQRQLPAGGDFTRELLLPNWTKLKKPGIYEISCTRSLELSRFQPGKKHNWSKKGPKGPKVTARTVVTVTPADTHRMGKLIGELGKMLTTPTRARRAGPC